MKHTFAWFAAALLLLLHAGCGQKILWQWSLESRCYSDLIIDGNILYVTSQAGEVIAGDYHTGKIQWKKKLPGSIFGAPDYTEKKLFLTTKEGDVFCLNKSDGSQVWKSHLPDNFGGSLTAAANMVLLASQTGHVYALSQESGNVLWTHSGDYQFISRPIVSGNYIFIGGWSSKLYCFRLDGTVNWTFKSAYVIVQDAVVDKNIVYFSAHDNFVYALDVPSGKLLWRFPGVEPTNAIRLKDDLVFADRTGMVFFLEARTGKLRKKYNVKMDVERIYGWKDSCLLIKNKVFELDREKGTLRKLISAKLPIYKIAASDNFIVASDDLYSIYGFPF